MQRPNIFAICISLTLLCSVFSCYKEPVDYSKDINDLKALVTELQQRSDSLATALGNTNTNLSNLSKSVDSIKLKLTGIQTQIDALTLSLTTANANIAAINAQLILLNQQYASLLEQLNAILALLNAAPPTLSDGLVAYYPFTGNAGDSSGNGNHGTAYDVILTIDRFGNSNQAYSFLGNTNSYIQTSKSGPSGIGFSVSYWYKSHNSILNPGDAVMEWGGPEWGTYFGVLNNWWSSETINPCNGPGITIGGSGYTPETNAVPDSTKWHNVVIIFPQTMTDLTSSKIYLDGILLLGSCSFANYGAPTPNISNVNPIRFGKGWQLDWVFYTGQLDDIRMYNRELKESEITYLASH